MYLPIRSMLLAIVPILSAGCAIHFTNAQTRIEPEFRRVYVPTATDSATSGGTAARLSMAVRRLLAANTRYQLVGPEEARWGLDMRIRERTPSVDSVEACTPAVVIGAGAVACDAKNIALPRKVSDREGLGLVIDVVAIDLLNGKTLGSETLTIKPSENTFAVVAEKEGEGARIRAGLARTPEMHALRYLENVDKATEAASRLAAARIVSLMESWTSKAR